MPKADVCRLLARVLGWSTVAGAVWGATREVLRDRQHSRAVRDQLTYLKQTGV